MLSAHMINGLIITCIVLLCIVLIIFKYRGNLHSQHSALRVEPKSEDATFETLIEYIKNALHELSHSQMADAGLHEEEYRRRIHQRAELRRALKDCANGSSGDKRFVKNLMSELLINGYGLNEKIADTVMPFSRPELFSTQDQFEIIFYQYQQKFGADALSRLLDTYDLAEMRYSQQGEEDGSYFVTQRISAISMTVNTVPFPLWRKWILLCSGFINITKVFLSLMIFVTRGSMV